MKDFEELCEEVRNTLKERMLEITKKNVLGPEDYESLLEEEERDVMYDPYDIENLLGEIGCPICRGKDGLFIGKCLAPGTGAGCNIDYASCERMGGERIGSFHTHPIGGTTPSVPDLECSMVRDEEIACIGGYDGEEYLVRCYRPRETARKYGLIYNPFVGYYQDKEEPDGKIEFYREPPPPTPEDLLADLSDKMIEPIVASYFETLDQEEIDRRVQRFRRELEEGEIPVEYWEGFESMEGYVDEIPFYSPEKLKKVEKSRLVKVSRDAMYCKL